MSGLFSERPFLPKFTRFLLGLYSVDDRLIHECEAVGGIRIGKGNRSTGGKPFQYYIVQHKSHMTQPGSPR
jgi:hypothetical protein